MSIEVSRSVAYLAVASLALAGLASVLPGAELPKGLGGVAQTETVRTILAKQGLASLVVKGRAAKTGYARNKFGPAWSDVDRNACDTRNDILRRDLDSIITDAHHCVVLSGELTDPYRRGAIVFSRGPGTSADVQIDHVVALADAWVKGAQQLTKTARLRFANDPLNLLATSDAMNAQKRSSDAASWLPARKTFRCQYVARQIAVKRTYRLWVTKAERKAMLVVLTDCPDELLPIAKRVGPPPIAEPGQTPTTSPTNPSSPEPTSSPPSSTVSSSTSDATTTVAPPATTPTVTATPSTTTTTANGVDPRYGTCTEAKKHGYGPYYRGRDPEYDWYRDADSDGIVCE